MDSHKGLFTNSEEELKIPLKSYGKNLITLNKATHGLKKKNKKYISKQPKLIISTNKDTLQQGFKMTDEKKNS